jgi:hypothetical protein
LNNKYVKINPSLFKPGDVFLLEYQSFIWQFNVVSGRGLNCEIASSHSGGFKTTPSYWTSLKKQGMNILVDRALMNEKQFHKKLKKLLKD